MITYPAIEFEWIAIEVFDVSYSPPQPSYSPPTAPPPMNCFEVRTKNVSEAPPPLCIISIYSVFLFSIVISPSKACFVIAIRVLISFPQLPSSVIMVPKQWRRHGGGGGRGKCLPYDFFFLSANKKCVGGPPPPPPVYYIHLFSISIFYCHFTVLIDNALLFPTDLLAFRKIFNFLVQYIWFALFVQFFNLSARPFSPHFSCSICFSP